MVAASEEFIEVLRERDGVEVTAGAAGGNGEVLGEGQRGGVEAGERDLVARELLVGGGIDDERGFGERVVRVGRGEDIGEVAGEVLGQRRDGAGSDLALRIRIP